MKRCGVVIAVVLVVIAPHVSAGLCPTNQPLPASVAQNEQFWAELCNLGWQVGGSPLPCPSANPPTVGTINSQAVVLTAVVPTGLGITSAVAVWWRAEFVGTGTVTVLWTFRSSLSPGLAPGATTTFRAPGLKTAGLHRFTVAFEDESNKLTCWSAPSSASTGSFAGGLTPPNLTSLRLEDEFNGPYSSFLSNGGNGIGPSEVYRTQQQVQIDADGHSARLSDPAPNAPSIGAGGVHGTIAGHSHGTSDVRYVNDLSVNSEYRVDAIARATPYNGSYKWYFAQVFKEGALPATLRVGYRDLTDTSSPLGITLASIACNPPLNVVEPSTPGRSKPVWIRLEVENDTQVPSRPKLTETVTWDGGEPCSISETDSDNRLPGTGYVGFVGHHKEYLVEQFLAGWKD